VPSKGISIREPSSTAMLLAISGWRSAMGSETGTVEGTVAGKEEGAVAGAGLFAGTEAFGATGLDAAEVEVDAAGAAGTEAGGLAAAAGEAVGDAVLEAGGLV